MQKLEIFCSLVGWQILVNNHGQIDNTPRLIWIVAAVACGQNDRRAKRMWIDFLFCSKYALEHYLPLASCLIYARALLEYVIFIMWLRSVIKMLPSVKFMEDKVLTFFILHDKC